MKPTLEQKYSTESCPVQKLAVLLSDTWTMLILRDLLVSQKRFCELEKSLLGISTRTLTLKLHKLIEEKIVEKNDLYYTLSKKGHAFKEVMTAMEKVGRTI